MHICDVEDEALAGAGAALRVSTMRADVAEEARENEYRAKTTMRRMVSTGDVAATMTCLCSPAGRNISGQALSVDGNVETL